MIEEKLERGWKVQEKTEDKNTRIRNSWDQVTLKPIPKRL